MKIFTYRAVDYSGKSVKGSIASETAEIAASDLTSKGLYVINVNEASSQIAYIRSYILKSQVKRTDILEFTGNFATMLKAGVPIITCLDDIISSSTNVAFKSILRDIQQRLESGSSVTTALEAHGKLFPEIVKTLVAVGEETGRLEESLREATEHLQRMHNLSGAIKKALMYPIFAFIATVSALIFWMLFVIPSMTSTLKSMGVKLPALTLLLINSSKNFQDNWLLIPITLIFVPLMMSIAGKNASFRYVRDRILINIPVLKVIILNRLLASFAEQFRMLICAGIPMKRLFDLLVPAVANEYLGAHLRKAKGEILNGNPISSSLDQEKVLPPLVISKIRIGESSGTLDKQLDFLAKYYIKKLDDATENLGKIIEPVVMSVIGGMFAIIIMGLLLPIYDLVSKVGKS